MLLITQASAMGQISVQSTDSARLGNGIWKGFLWPARPVHKFGKNSTVQCRELCAPLRPHMAGRSSCSSGFYGWVKEPHQKIRLFGLDYIYEMMHLRKAALTDSAQ
jgi:hypothetical protein